jgi:thiamine biosynthesis lipoprotein ApbE
MGMPITIEIVNCQEKELFKNVFDFFRQVDKQFSPYKKSSEVTQINQGKIQPKDYSNQMKQIISLSKKTKLQTDGYFDIYNNEVLDPSGLVKGWAILKLHFKLKKPVTKIFISVPVVIFKVAAKISRVKNGILGFAILLIYSR